MPPHPALSPVLRITLRSLSVCDLTLTGLSPQPSVVTLKARKLIEPAELAYHVGNMTLFLLEVKLKRGSFVLR